MIWCINYPNVRIHSSRWSFIWGCLYVNVLFNINHFLLKKCDKFWLNFLCNMNQYFANKNKLINFDLVVNNSIHHFRDSFPTRKIQAVQSTFIKKKKLMKLRWGFLFCYYRSFSTFSKCCFLIWWVCINRWLSLIHG